MKKHGMGLLAAGMLLLAASSLTVFAAEEALVPGASAVVGESTVIGESQSQNSARVQELLGKAKPWDGKDLTGKGVWALTGDVTLTQNCTVGKDAILLVPADYRLTAAGGTLTCQGEIAGQMVVNGGSVQNSGTLERAAVLDGTLENRGQLQELLLAGGQAKNHPEARIQDLAADGGKLQNDGVLISGQLSGSTAFVNGSRAICRQLYQDGGSCTIEADSIAWELQQQGGSCANAGLVENWTVSGGEALNSSVVQKMQLEGGVLQNRRTIEGLSLLGGTLQNRGTLTGAVELSGGVLENWEKGSADLVRQKDGQLSNNGRIGRLQCQGGQADNGLTGKMEQVELDGGQLRNIGAVDQMIQTGGELSNGARIQKLEQNGGASYNLSADLDGCIDSLWLSGGRMDNQGRVGEAAISGQGQLYNREGGGNIRQVVLKNTGSFQNSGQVQSVTNLMGEELSLLTVGQVSPQIGTVTVQAERRDAAGRYVAHGRLVELTAQAADGWVFERWSVSGVEVASETDHSTTFLMPEGAVDVQAVFVPEPPKNPVTESDQTAIPA